MVVREVRKGKKLKRSRNGTGSCKVGRTSIRRGGYKRARTSMRGKNMGQKGSRDVDVKLEEPARKCQRLGKE